MFDTFLIGLGIVALVLLLGKVIVGLFGLKRQWQFMHEKALLYDQKRWDYPTYTAFQAFEETMYKSRKTMEVKLAQLTDDLKMSQIRPESRCSDCTWLMAEFRGRNIKGLFGDYESMKKTLADLHQQVYEITDPFERHYRIGARKTLRDMTEEALEKANRANNRLNASDAVKQADNAATAAKTAKKRKR